MANHRRNAAKERFWSEHLASWRRSGLSVRAYCLQHHLSPPSFYQWRRLLRERAATPTSQQPAAPSVPANSPFLPVRLVGELLPQVVLELVLRGGRVIRVPAGFAPETLRQLITLAEQLPC